MTFPSQQTDKPTVTGSWLIVHTGGGLGDVLLSTCVLKALRDAGAETVDYLCLQKNSGVLQGLPGVRNLWTLPGRSPQGLSSWLQWRRKLLNQNYQGALVLWGNASIAWLLWAASIKVRVGQDSRLLYSFLYTHPVRVRSEHGDTASHWTEIFLDYVRVLGVEPEPPQVFLPLQDSQPLPAEIHSLPRPWIGFHCSKGLPPDLNRWPVECFANWAQALSQEVGGTLIFTGSAPESVLVRQLLKLANLKHFLDLSGKTSLEGLVRLASACDVFVCPDSGPMHVAAAAGCKIVGVYALAEDFPDRWAPLARHRAIVRPNPVGCPPGCHKGNCPRFRCYEKVSSTSLVSAVRALLERPADSDPVYLRLE